MSIPIFTRSFSPPPVNEKEIFRYAGAKDPDESLARLLEEVREEAMEKFVYRVCYGFLPFSKGDGGFCDFDAFSLFSGDLTKNLCSCHRVIAFCATVGVGIDRLIARYSSLSPAKAVLLHAMGAERVEALCDAFCGEMEAECRVPLRPRFSPGYGDLSLSVQRNLFALLDPTKRIGVALNTSLLLSPSKSVTAFIGICDR